MKAIGIMSGTSCDGVDAILIDIATLTAPHPCDVLGSSYIPFPPALRAELMQPDKLTTRRLTELHFLLPDYYQQAVTSITNWQAAEVCGMHGQTVWHQPSDPHMPATLQIGSSAALAQRIHMPVVGDLRAADVALGGQGAPIVPFAHWFFLSRRAPLLVVNLGGMCNITWVTHDVEHVLAYDIGPGMVLSDAFANLCNQNGVGYDKDGAGSQGGTIVPGLLAEILAHPFVQRPPPKSTGREDFGHLYSAPLLAKYRAQANDRDIGFTLVTATLEILKHTVHADARLKGQFGHILLTGGGARNPTLVAQAKTIFPQCTIEVALDGVMAPQHHEPAAMALIAARTMAKLPSSLPAVTGARRSAILGHLHVPTL